MTYKWFMEHTKAKPNRPWVDFTHCEIQHKFVVRGKRLDYLCEMV